MKRSSRNREKMEKVKDLLNHFADKFNSPDFIEEDPISIPHMFSKSKDIEVAGFFASILSWGRRRTIINKSKELMSLMDNSPFDFVRNHREEDRKRFEKFVHRTFQYTDTLYFLDYLNRFYQENETLENLFCNGDNLEQGLINFHDAFFSLPHAPQRTRKHLPTPARKSTCKRINMYLRWMVRSDTNGVDFGIWKQLKASQLFIPLDVHVDMVARSLGLIKRKQTNWLTTLELTGALRQFDQMDPVKYDFALFGLGVLRKDLPPML